MSRAVREFYDNDVERESATNPPLERAAAAVDFTCSRGSRGHRGRATAIRYAVLSPPARLAGIELRSVLAGKRNINTSSNRFAHAASLWAARSMMWTA